MTYFAPLALLIALLLALWFGWRLISERRSLPCPTSLAWLLENPFTSGYHSTVVARLELSPGLHVLDAGCGPGLLTTAIAPVTRQGRGPAPGIPPRMIANGDA